MRRWGALVVAVVVLLAVGGPGPVRAEASGVELLSDQVLPGDGRLHELTFFSWALRSATKVRVLLPAGFDDPANADRRYPVLLLVHGAGGDEANWTEKTDVEGSTAGLDLIVVMPDGGDLGFYSDWLDGPQWETFHLDELLPWVESTYRGIGTREGRAVAGMSMGGFGSMTYAARHPDRFVAAASFSGAVDLTGIDAVEMAILNASLITPNKLWGPFLTHQANWRSHNPADIARNLHGVTLRVDVGTGIPCPGDNVGAAPIEVPIHLMNVSFDHALQVAGVPHEYRVAPCGVHRAPVWDADLRSWLPVLMGVFAAPPPPPASFSYRTAEPSFSVWDWSFTVARPAVELLDLTDVSVGGLTATGSGTVDVVTPPSYLPGAAYAVAAQGADVRRLPIGRTPDLSSTPLGAPVSSVMTADASGRLHFTVDLGPGHTENQYSPGGILAELLALGPYYARTTVTISPAP